MMTDGAYLSEGKKLKFVKPIAKGNNIRLYHLVVQGALATAGKYSLNSWAVAKKGPSYPPMFSPLSVVFTVVLGCIFIGDDITVGRSVTVFLSTSMFYFCYCLEGKKNTSTFAQWIVHSDGIM